MQHTIVMQSGARVHYNSVDAIFRTLEGLPIALEFHYFCGPMFLDKEDEYWLPEENTLEWYNLWSQYEGWWKAKGQYIYKNDGDSYEDCYIGQEVVGVSSGNLYEIQRVHLERGRVRALNLQTEVISEEYARGLSPKEHAPKFKMGDKVEVFRGGYGVAFDRDLSPELQGQVVTITVVSIDGYGGDIGYKFATSIPLSRELDQLGIDGWVGEETFRLVESTTDSESQEEKPPLGLMPKGIHQYKRMISITEAMERYSKEDKHIPLAWVEELKELLEELYHG